LSFWIAGRHGPTLALMLGAGFAGAASVASGLRLFAPSHRNGAPATSARVKEPAAE
jgi:DHA2 family multidrug resistance protein-like MFS transporter